MMSLSKVILWIFLGPMVVVAPSVFGQFTTVVNVPPGVAPTSIESDTQLNLFDGAVLVDGFQAGGVGSFENNLEVNVFGGNVGDSFALEYVTANIAGGEIGDNATFNGTTALVSGGNFGDGLNIQNSSIVTIAGGTFGDRFRAAKSTLILSGNDFRLNGVPVDSLTYEGTDVPLRLDGTLLSGTLSDGTPFAFSSLADNFKGRDDRLFSLRGLALDLVPLPPVEAVSVTPARDVHGIREGQTMRVGSGNVVVDNFTAGRGSHVLVVPDGQIGRNFEAVAAEVTVSGGKIGDGFDAYDGSTVTITGGEIGESFHVYNNTRVYISGGSIGCGFAAFAGSATTISAGTFDCEDQSSISLLDGSEVEILGSEFFLGGERIEGLANPGDTITLTDRRGFGVTGRFADHTDFEISIAPYSRQADVPDGIVRLTVAVPEPPHTTLALTALLIVVGWGRRHVCRGERTWCRIDAVSSLGKAGRCGI